MRGASVDGITNGTPRTQKLRGRHTECACNTAALLAARRAASVGDRRRAGRHALLGVRPAGRGAGQWHGRVLALRRRRSDVGRRPENPGPADPQPDQPRHPPVERPVQDRQPRARPPAARFSLGRRERHPRDGQSARRLRLGADGKRRLLRPAEANRGAGRGASHDDASRHRAPSAARRPTEIAAVGRPTARPSANNFTNVRGEMLRLRYRQQRDCGAGVSPAHAAGTAAPQTARAGETPAPQVRRTSTVNLRSFRPAPTKSNSSRTGWSANSNGGWPRSGGTWP